jgi:hypothetical protein
MTTSQLFLILGTVLIAPHMPRRGGQILGSVWFVISLISVYVELRK